MKLLIWILTAIIVLDCGLLVLLILVQLPKKEAGMGTAFGGGATDALFGAGSGNVLTKLTKYSSGIFLGLALLLSVLIVRQNHQKGLGLEKELQKKATTTMGLSTPTTPTSAPSGVKASISTNQLLITTNLLSPLASGATNLQAKPTNAPKANPIPPVATPAPEK
jgi:preprotein translocase subunit SecG